MTGEDVVDWDAVFRTIDHQQGAGNVARDRGQSGTQTAIENGLYRHQPDWPGAEPASSGIGMQDRNALLEQYTRYLLESSQPEAQAESSSRSRRTSERESQAGRQDPNRPSYAAPQKATSNSASAIASPHERDPQDLDIRAMLQAMGHGQTVPTVPEPGALQRIGTNGRRRRSHSLGPRRSASDTIPPLPLFTPQANYNLSDHFPFASPTFPQPPHPPSTALSSDFFNLLNQQPQNTHPTPSNFASTSTTPLQTYTPYPPATTTRSSLATPLQSPRTAQHHDPTPPSTANSGGAAPTPGAEADSEDKRVRNTLASARFRAKRKAHLAEVEQQITQLEGRSTTLQRQVEDLKKENLFLKEMVQLKYGLDVDKRM